MIIVRRSLALLLAGTLLSSQSYASGPGTTTGELLKIPVGTRAIGMGEAYTALADDSSALYWNPAGMSLTNQKEVTFEHEGSIHHVARGCTRDEAEDLVAMIRRAMEEKVAAARAA